MKFWECRIRLLLDLDLTSGKYHFFLAEDCADLCRNSLPNGSIARPGQQLDTASSHLGMGQIDTSFLYTEADKNGNAKNAPSATNSLKTYLQMTDADDFPVLVRRDSFPGVVMIFPSPFIHITKS